MTDAFDKREPVGANPPGPAPAAPSWSQLAIVSFFAGVVAFGINLFFHVAVAAVLPILGGLQAVVEIKRTGRRGRWLAIAGMVLGGVSLVLYSFPRIPRIGHLG